MHIEHRPGIALAVNADNGIFPALLKGSGERIIVRGRGIAHADALRENQLFRIVQIFFVVGKVDLVADRDAVDIREHFGNYADLRARGDLLGGEILTLEDFRVTSDEL